MEIRNISTEAMEIPNVGVVEAGGTIEVPDDIGKSLAQQDEKYEKVTAKRKASS